jgi:AraC-like DNA-binding protein
MSNNIPVHRLTHSSFFLAPIEDTDDETFDGLHRHDFFELIWFTHSKPSDTVEIDFTTHKTGNNTICLLVPGQVFTMTRKSQKGYVMAFAKDLFDEVIQNRPLYSIGIIPSKLNNSVIRSLQAILPLITEEYKGKRRMELLKAYLTAFLFHILESPLLKTDSRVNDLMKLIEENYLTERETTFYAAQLNVSIKHLNALTKKERDVTVKELILQRVILEARREINFGKLTLKEIAFKLGFNDPAYFSRFFKKQTGVSAEQFKADISTRQWAVYPFTNSCRM